MINVQLIPTAFKSTVNSTNGPFLLVYKSGPDSLPFLEIKVRVFGIYGHPDHLCRCGLSQLDTLLVGAHNVPQMTLIR
jgi:hypothetical protein